MKIVNRATFLALPAGTIFAKFEPIIFGELSIKVGNAGSNDFVVQDLIPWFVGTNDSAQHFDQLEAIAAGGASPALDFESSIRDGLFDADQMFAVFERRDVEALIGRLSAALAEGYPQ